MSVSGDLAQQEDVIRRLRELHDTADDEDRPRAVLLLGLAIADLVAGLPDDDARRGELAAEGLSRLAESADDSAGVATARELLRGCLPAAASKEPAREPESFPLGGSGKLDWDLDWEALRGSAEAARNLTAMLPFLASMFPPTEPLGQALTSIVEVIDAFDQGQWSPERDTALTKAIKQVEAGGLGTGLAVMLRAIAMMIRVRRCQEAERATGQPNWPALAELDTLIADMESADDLGSSLGAPFQAVDGMHHLFIAAVVMMRIMVDIRQPDVRRDQPWRDGILGLLDRADDHLRQTPPAYAARFGRCGARWPGCSPRSATRRCGPGRRPPRPRPRRRPPLQPRRPPQPRRPQPRRPQPAVLSHAVGGRSGLRPGHGPGHGSVLSADPAGTAGSRRPD